MVVFGERLKELRLEKGLSQGKLAKETGLTQSCIIVGKQRKNHRTRKQW